MTSLRHPFNNSGPKNQDTGPVEDNSVFTAASKDAVISIDQNLAECVPIPDGPEAWWAGLESKIRAVEAKGKESILLERLRRLARAWAETDRIKGILTVLKRQLTGLRAELLTVPLAQKGEIQAAIGVVEDLISKFTNHHATLPVP